MQFEIFWLFQFIWKASCDPNPETRLWITSLSADLQGWTPSWCMLATHCWVSTSHSAGWCASRRATGSGSSRACVERLCGYSSLTCCIERNSSWRFKPADRSLFVFLSSSIIYPLSTSSSSRFNQPASRFRDTLCVHTALFWGLFYFFFLLFNLFCAAKSLIKPHVLTRYLANWTEWFHYTPGQPLWDCCHGHLFPLCAHTGTICCPGDSTLIGVKMHSSQRSAVNGTDTSRTNCIRKSGKLRKSNSPENSLSMFYTVHN